jgi:hypothetical protein
VARLQAEREERQAVGEALVGLARQEVARRKSQYDADIARLYEAQEALEVARQQLTGNRERGPFTEVPRPRGGPLTSTLGSVVTTPDRVQDPERQPEPEPEPEPASRGAVAGASVPEQRAADAPDLPGDTNFVAAATRPNEENGYANGNGK